MKFLLVLSLSLSSLSVFAHDHDKGPSLEDAKAKILAHLEKRISHINETKTCVSAATSKEALKVCKDNMRSKGKAMRDEAKNKKK